MRRFTFSCLSLMLGASFAPSFATCLEELRAFDRSQLKKACEPDENIEIPSSALAPEEPTPLRLVVSEQVLLEMRGKLKAPCQASSSTPKEACTPGATATSPTQTMDREERIKLLRKATMTMIASQPKLAPANHTRQKIPKEVLDGACYKTYEALKGIADNLLLIERGMKQEQESLKALMLKKQRLDEYLQLVEDPDIQKALSTEGEKSPPPGLAVREKLAHFTKVQTAFYAEELEDIPLLQQMTEAGIDRARSQITGLSGQAEALRKDGSRFNTDLGKTTLRVEQVLQNKARLHVQLGEIVEMQPAIPEEPTISQTPEISETSKWPEKVSLKTEWLIAQWEACCLEELMSLESQSTPMGEYIQSKRSKGYRWFIHYHTGVSLRKEGPSELQSVSSTLCAHLAHVSQKWGFGPIVQDVSEPLRSPRQMDMTASMTMEMSDLLSSMVILDPSSFYGEHGGAALENAAASSVPPDQGAQVNTQATWGGWLTFISERFGLGYLIGSK